MLNHIQAVLFDLDGTLIDSMWLWRDIDIEYLNRFGIVMPPTLQEDIAGISITQTAIYFKEHFGIADDIETIIADWNAMAREKYQYQTPLKAGARDFLNHLKQANIRCAVATSNSRQLTEIVLNSHGLTAYFDAVLTGEDVHNGKPAPDIYLEAARRLSVDPEYCLVFEDISHGIKAGLHANMRVCAVEDDYSGLERDLKKHLAHYYIQSYDDILNKTYEERL